MLLFRDVTVAGLTLLFTVMAKRVRDQQYTMAGLTLLFTAMAKRVRDQRYTMAGLTLLFTVMFVTSVIQKHKT